MIEAKAYRESNTLPTQEQFIRVLQGMPKSGMAFRGDPVSRVPEFQQKGLTTPWSKYIIFLPPQESSRQWNKETQHLYEKLESGIETAMVFADPWYEEGAHSAIREPDFQNYSMFFSKNPSKIPAISWFTPTKPDQFLEVATKGELWHDRVYEHQVGSVEKFGAIPTQHIEGAVVPSPARSSWHSKKYSSLLEKGRFRRTLSGVSFIELE